MLLRTKITLIVVFALGALAGMQGETLFAELRMQKTAIAHLCGGYDIDTGKFRWDNRAPSAAIANEMPMPPGLAKKVEKKKVM